MTFSPTAEQQSIFEHVARGDNCMVDALAGVGKSTTIKHALSRVPRGRTIACLSFNKKIKDDMEKDLKKLGFMHENISILTMNGLGHKAISTSLRKRPELNNDKIFELSKEVGFKRDDLSDCMALVRSARMAGIVPRGVAGRAVLADTDENWASIADNLDIDPILTTPARDILRKSIALALQGIIDYDDQIYISTLILGLYPKFDVVFVDEAQDLSPFNHIQVSKSAKSQIVVVGDPHQAIYAWRGADHQSMNNIRALRPEWTNLLLSTTFRCPRAVVARQRDHVPAFNAARTNIEGHIERLSQWYPDGGKNAAILCRNNAPLIRLAFQLLRERVPVNYLGRDIGGDLKRLYNKLSDHGKKSIETTIANAHAYIQQNPDRIDRAESLIAVLESHDSVDEAMRFLTESRTNAITLSTGHRAKGLEWDKVYHLNPWLIPNKWVMELKPENDGFPESKEEIDAQARFEAAYQQELNLRYVIETRTKNELYFVNLEYLQ